MNKSNLKEWFVFTRRDRNAAFVLLLITGLIIVLPYLVPAKKMEIHVDKELQAELDQYRQQQPNSFSSFNYAATDTSIHDTIKHALFVFDPNTLNEEGLIKLGLSQKVTHTLINYRNKGGHFKTPEDIRKIYGLSKTDADRLIPYIQIASSNKQTEISKFEQPVAKATTSSYKKININTATAEDWKAFPGIGDVIGNRIVKFRTSIGGFKTIEQVGKTYGLSDSVFQKIKPYLYLGDSTQNRN